MLRVSLRFAENIYRQLATKSSPSEAAQLFLRRDVQNLLRQVRGNDYTRVFASRSLTPAEASRLGKKDLIDFMTKEELAKAVSRTELEVDRRLQPFPVLPVLPPGGDAISSDTELDSIFPPNEKLVFIDLSTHWTPRNRPIVAREPTGILRESTASERSRLAQMYFPKETRMMKAPVMFHSPDLDRLVNQKKYIYLLERTVVQFEPYDTNFHRIMATVFDHVDKHKDHQLLRSTRFYGNMVFHLVCAGNLDNLLLFLLDEGLIEDASAIIQLHCIINGETISLPDYVNSSSVLKSAYLKANTKKTNRHKSNAKLQSSL